MEEKDENKSVMSYFANVLKTTDKFGLAISLNHNEKYEFHTVTGIILSLILYFIVGYTCIVLIIRIVSRHEINVEITNTDNRFQFSNETVKPLENGKFMVGFLAVNDINPSENS